jgi:hypothetical protein
MSYAESIYVRISLTAIARIHVRQSRSRGLALHLEVPLASFPMDVGVHIGSTEAW